MQYQTYVLYGDFRKINQCHARVRVPFRGSMFLTYDICREVVSCKERRDACPMSLRTGSEKAPETAVGRGPK